ncbi:hypothetical protein ID80_005125, partial [Salmonella enterica subsp. enterica serovar Ball]|nr:hypothetical protein [Salmonella enterica subsp. enterica serovar Ball]
MLNATTGNLNLTVNGSGNFNNGGGNITLQAAKNVSVQVNSSGTGTILYLGGLNITAGQDIIACATTRTGGNWNVIRGDNATLNATGNISLTATGNRTANGSNASINLNSSTSLTAGQGITLNGSTTGNGNGVSLDNVTLNATTLNLTGSSQGGTGFSLTNITLSEALKNLTNVTLSSAGSSASATNAIGKIFDATQVAALINKGIENLTTVNVNGLTLGGEGNDWTNTPS